MRLFQNSGIAPAYVKRLRGLTRDVTSFAGRRDAFLADRYGAVHILMPVLDASPDAFFTNGDDEHLQRAWAAEQGLSARASLVQILLAQIENHRADVFYNTDPMRYGSPFVRQLPGCVKRTIAWRAAPSPRADFGSYDLVVCNFPSILAQYRELGWRAAYFSPAYDPAMAPFAANEIRPIDVLFVGGYSRHHQRRATVLEAVAALRTRYKVALHLDRSRLTRVAESPLGRLLPLKRHRRPPDIRAVTQQPVFGLDLYAALSSAKIVINCAVDMAGEDRGNMRCFEALGCGALMISDAGRYPEGMQHGKTMIMYSDARGAADQSQTMLKDEFRRRRISAAGHRLLETEYDKNRQWMDFNKLVASC